MLNRWMEASLRQRWLVLALALAAAVMGALAYLQLPIDAFPDISPTQVKVILKVPGMTPEEVEQRVATPIEIEMLGIPHKRMVRSMAKYGIVDVTIDFDEGTDVYWARQQVSERLAGVMRELPPSAAGGLAPIATPLSEMFMFTLEGEGHSLAERRRVLDWVIRPALRTLPGVAEVNALGGEVRSYEVIPDPQRLAGRGVTLAELRQALLANARNDGAGRLDSGEEALAVRVEGGILGTQDAAQIVVAQREGRVVTVGDVATVRLGAATRYGAVTRNGTGETVQGLVLGLRGANAREVVAAVGQRLAELQPQLPPGLRIEVFYNRGDLVERAAGTVLRALLEACALVVVMLYLFLGGLRPALVVAVTLPLTLLVTFFLMGRVGLTANLMSLGGLVVAIGMLVDAAVVVVENVEARLAQEAQAVAGPVPRARLLALVGEAVREVAVPVLSGVAIIAIVFLPLLSLQGLEGKLFAPVAQTIVLALAVSAVVAFAVVPPLCAVLLKAHGAEPPWLIRWLQRGFARLQQASFAHPRPVFGAAGLLLAAAAVLYALTGKTFMPTLDEGDLIVQLQKLPSISLGASTTLDTRVQQALLAGVPQVRSVVARAGADDLGLDPMGFNETDTFLVLRPKEEWGGSKEDIMDGVRRVMAQFPGVAYSFTQPIEMRVSEMLTGSRGDVALKLFGNDLHQIDQAAQQVAARLRQLRGASEVIAPRNEGMQYLSLRVDRLAAGQAGFSADQLQETLRNQIEGETLSLIAEGVVRTPLVLRGSEQVREAPQNLGALVVRSPAGQSWPLSSLAQLRQTEGPVRIDHENGSRFAVIQINVEGRDLAGFVEEAQAAVATLGLAREIRLQWGGQFENQQRAAARLALVVPVALAAIYALLFLTFRSARQAALVFANIPFALVGGIAALKLSGEYLSVPASVGFIALLGIAVLNGLVLVSYFNQLLQQGEPMHRVVREGARRRLRPVLMTAGITALGLIPLLFASGPGSEIQRPLAIVVCGGLVTSTVLTLLLLPMLFERFGRPPPDRDHSLPVDSQEVQA
ncbi:efflux RND transporter permease subunit [Variovorax terrae]|uniref:CusA/CzcA family heavy metal efflux RND transporter n=1 Tax=Variovorax terrae TaxID=2923278 RepID=A0A9X1VXL5_9BURK|nr:CusA/CzcA family heavy metal efflux RND transporter [Variovorax terrae]MCJ0765160.1 CusA/CzcA family heavy metal efflux RND transporter [Variovorax terrae]